jgi:hypothetical protein
MKRREAKLLNLITYNTEKPCKKGHFSDRVTSNGLCKVCRNEIVSKYKRSNKAVVNATNGKRRALKINITQNWLLDEHFKQITEFYKMAKELEKVFPWKQHVDHVVPLKGEFVSGLHVPWNLQILSEKENLEKSNKHVN